MGRETATHSVGWYKAWAVKLGIVNWVLPVYICVGDIMIHIIICVQTQDLFTWNFQLLLYTLSHLENDRDVSAYARATCVFPHTFKKEHRD